MVIFIDCEFNGFGGQLISMALVPLKSGVSDGIEGLYFELPIVEPVHQWVEEHVVPLLWGGQYLMSRERAQRLVERWLGQFDEVYLIADWPDDIRYFCEFLITGPGVKFGTPPLKMEIMPIKYVSEVPHHAYHDAIAIRAEYRRLVERFVSRGT